MNDGYWSKSPECPSFHEHTAGRCRHFSAPRVRVHVSSIGTYHPDPTEDVAWTVYDARGYTDEGPPCDECGACDCEREHVDGEVCPGLSFAFVCLDGGEALCEECAKNAVVVVSCDCETKKEEA